MSFFKTRATITNTIEGRNNIAVRSSSRCIVLVNGSGSSYAVDIFSDEYPSDLAWFTSFVASQFVEKIDRFYASYDGGTAPATRPDLVELSQEVLNDAEKRYRLQARREGSIVANVSLSDMTASVALAYMDGAGKLVLGTCGTTKIHFLDVDGITNALMDRKLEEKRLALLARIQQAAQDHNKHIKDETFLASPELSKYSKQVAARGIKAFSHATDAEWVQTTIGLERVKGVVLYSEAAYRIADTYKVFSTSGEMTRAMLGDGDISEILDTAAQRCRDDNLMDEYPRIHRREAFGVISARIAEALTPTSVFPPIKI